MKKGWVKSLSDAFEGLPNREETRKGLAFQVEQLAEQLRASRLLHVNHEEKAIRVNCRDDASFTYALEVAAIYATAGTMYEVYHNEEAVGTLLGEGWKHDPSTGAISANAAYTPYAQLETLYTKGVI